jgi:hypothetical protein
VLAGFAAAFVEDRKVLLYAAGALLNVPILIALWGGRISASIQQLLWNGHQQDHKSLAAGVLILFHTLHWGRYWALTLVLVTPLLAYAAFRHRSRNLMLSAAFALAGVVILLHRGTRPYYLVYFSTWAILALVIFAEEHWEIARLFAIPVVAIWLMSAAWNVMRVRESVLYYHQLSAKKVDHLLRQDVPPNATIDSTPNTWVFPIEARRGFVTTTWLPEEQRPCADCYVLMTLKNFTDGKFFTPTNRKILYDGPAFPGSGQLRFPIVLLSPLHY